MLDPLSIRIGRAGGKVIRESSPNFAQSRKAAGKLQPFLINQMAQLLRSFARGEARDLPLSFEGLQPLIA